MAASENAPIPHDAGFVPDLHPSRFLLGPGCWHEPALARVLSRSEEIWLTPRENILLSILLSAPDQWHRTCDLAALLSERADGEEVSLQSIRQSMLGLRKKLGKCGVSPDLLRCRPWHGYGIFPPKAPAPDS